MSSRTRKRRRLTAEINVVPYIDVMLVLLIIFMVTAPLLKSGVEVDLPNAAAQPMTSESGAQPIVVTVDAQGRFYLNAAPNPDNPLPPAQLKRLAAEAIAASPDAPVSVKGDAKGQYGDVVRAMTLLQKAGADTIGLQTESVAPSGPQAPNDSANDQRSSGR